MKLIRNLRIRHKLYLITAISVINIILVGFTANYFFKTSDVVAYILKGHRLHNVNFHAGIRDFYKYQVTHDTNDLQSALAHLEYADKLSYLFGNVNILPYQQTHAEFEKSLYNSFGEAFGYDFNAAKITANRVKLLLKLNSPNFNQSLEIAREVNKRGRDVLKYMKKYMETPGDKDITLKLNEAINSVISYELTFANGVNGINTYVMKLLLLGIVVIVLLLGTLTLATSLYIAGLISKPILTIVDSFKNLAEGDLSNEIAITSKDEIGILSKAINSTLQILKDTTNQANTIATGNYDLKISPRSEKDVLGIALSHMTEQLRTNSLTINQQNWLKEGLANLNDMVRGDKELQKITKEVISFITKSINGQVGILYLIDNDGFLIMTSTYAYHDRRGNFSKIKVGEGIVGQCASEKEIIEFIGLNQDAPVYNNGLLEAIPAYILTAPLVFEETLIGVILLGKQEAFTSLQKTFITTALENTAISINSTQTRSKIEQLLKQTQEQTEKLQVQQEELRQSNEELEEQTRALKASEEALQAQQEELRVTNEELEERTRTLEKERDTITKKNQELRLMQEEVEKKANDLEAASKYKSEFLANMSHELRTPLNSILVLSQLLADNKNGNLVDKQIEFAKTINSSGADLLSLINDILDLSKIESGRIDIHPERIVLTELTAWTEKAFTHLAQEKGIAFETQVDPNLPSFILSDYKRLNQILKNLLSNAIKFTDKGMVKLTVAKPKPNTTFKRTTLSANDAIAFTISDTGIGIATEKQQVIFEAFQQADGTTSRRYGGTGLGLTISKSFAQILDGEIHLESRVGEGSSFTLYLPLAVPASDPSLSIVEAEPTTRPTTTENANQAKAKPQIVSQLIPDDRDNLHPGDRILLIIEDDTNFASVLYNLALEKGFKCIVAHEGETGLHYADFYKPNAIILDIGLPGIDGFEVLRRIKENPETRHIPVHFMSAHEETNNAMKMGAIGFLTKPVSLEKLTTAFKRIEDFIAKEVRRLLIVEDDANMRKSIKELIGDKDVSTIAVDNGDKAYELLQQEQFDCIILDLGLKGSSGYEVLEKIRKNETISRIPIVIYTGKDLSQEEETMLKKYADSIIIKGAKSPERLLAETSIFLHRIEASLPNDKQKQLDMLQDKEDVFKNKKILVVDDDMRNVFALSSVLEEKGMNIVVGRNGRDGIEKLEKNPDTSLIIMDIMMPEMDGYEAISLIRKAPKLQKIPIIALTAKAMKDDREKCIAAGANDYLTKPVDTARLLSLLRVWLYK